MNTPTHKWHILCTAPIGRSMSEEAAGAGIALEELSFIDTEQRIDEVTGREIIDLSNRSAVVVFTSAHAVEAVIDHLGVAGERCDWQIFCLGSGTQKSVSTAFGVDSIRGMAMNAGDLAETILKQGNIPEVWFFCGDRRRNELPKRLNEAGILLRELIVYTTILTPHKVDGVYDGLIFFSPSAVHSYFSGNSTPPDTLLFAIGRTTTDAIREFSANRVIVGSIPDKEALVRQAIDYFKDKN